MVPFHGAVGFNLWMKPVVSSQMTLNPNHVSGFAKYDSTLCSFALYGALHRGLHRMVLQQTAQVGAGVF